MRYLKYIKNEDRNKRGAGNESGINPLVAWSVLGVFALALVMGTAVSCASGESFDSQKFEEAAQIYEIEADSPTVLGDLVKISEAEFSEGLEDIGADEGRILEYANDVDYVLVMVFSFASDNMARDSFEELEGGIELAEDLYEVEEGFYRYLYGKEIYLVSGPVDAVFTVLKGLALTTTTGPTPHL